MSRIGGGTVASLRMGFESQVSPAFVSNFDQEIQALILSGPPSPTREGVMPQWLVLKDLDLQYPDLINRNERARRAFFEERGFKSLPHRQACIQAWLKRTSNSEILLMIWGPDRGVVATATATPMSLEGLDSIFATIRLTDGACGWK
ncbi:MAG: hypothetical protein KF802_08330 [Bdellovibrionaceae bacterium]|nr:hypothetical protein [Pseudobdellovibrionaceae bacterium]MBX3034939.1 hypothetical protein [Pseudobdellovibrionaceae bacterium]